MQTFLTMMMIFIVLGLAVFGWITWTAFWIIALVLVALLFGSRVISWLSNAGKSFTFNLN